MPDPTGSTAPPVPEHDRFSRLEDPNDDFPYYNGHPVLITGARWLLVMVFVALGFYALGHRLPGYEQSLGTFLPGVLFFALPLLGLWLATPAHWRAIFRRVRPRDVGWMLGIAVLNIVVSVGVGALLQQVTDMSANAAIHALGTMAAGDRVTFFLRTIPQLFGEELLTILPFLALLYLFHGKLGLSRKQAILCGWVLSALLFGAAHLPTYNWNFLQAFGVIGTARVVLLLAYIKTKNIWVSTGAHILNDWIMFAVTMFGPAAAGG